MPATPTNLFLLQDLEDPSRTGKLADSDLAALQAVADWIKAFVVKPHKDLGRAGTVCPFVPGSLERKVAWLAPEQIAGRGEPDAVQLMNGYKRLFLWLSLWARRYGESAVQALAGELRRTNWRQLG